MRVIKEHFTHPDESFRFLRFSVDAFRGQWHRHRQIELTWIERGSGIRLVGDNAAPFASGDLVLLGANLPHLWTSARTRGDASSIASVIQLPPDLLTIPALPELARLESIIDRARWGLQITGAGRNAITRMMIQMRVMRGLRRMAVLFAIFDELVRHEIDLRAIATRPAVDEDEVIDAKRNRIERVIKWVHENFADPMRVESAAEVAHVTPAAFSRFFHRETGKTFGKYVNEVRCSAACLVLKNSDRPISLIAGECGFTTLSNFNRQFLAQTGTTPLRYRSNN